MYTLGKGVDWDLAYPFLWARLTADPKEDVALSLSQQSVSYLHTVLLLIEVHQLP